jgi:hypothetical protein
MDGQDQGQTSHSNSGEHDNDPDTHMGDEDSGLITLARAAAEAGLYSSAAQALASPVLMLMLNMDNINHNIDPGIFGRSSILLMS